MNVQFVVDRKIKIQLYSAYFFFFLSDFGTFSPQQILPLLLSAKNPFT